MPDVQALVNDFLIKLKKRKIEGSQATTRQAAELLRSVISQQRVPYTNQAGALIDVVRAVGEQLIAANPVELAVGNIMGRVLHIIREENLSLQQLLTSNHDADPMLRSSGISINAQLILAVAASSVSCDRELYLCNNLTPSTTEKDESLIITCVLDMCSRYMIFYTIQSAVIGLCMDRSSAAWKLEWNLQLLTIIYSGSLASAATFCLISWAVARRGPSYPPMFNPLTLIFVAVLEALILGAEITVGTLLGMVLMIIIGLYSLLGKANEMTNMPKLSIEALLRL
ncbi:hypothetical protein DKX38_018192 [Salix brachista]|uniref:Uncharacterized protein n=1 Tax=Salix brachista TaxID=2182728 RepID=A0A5N5KME4_9ROSI|nr:hypothetical protein DKX38_018192 [Salix brachista]